MLLAHPDGNYHFLRGIDPYSCGVIADPGYEIVHATLAESLPWQQGFKRVEAYLNQLQLNPNALCGMELRSPKPFTMQGFVDFNKSYCSVLKEWGLYIDDLNPVARTNIAPMQNPPSEPQLHAFSYVIANSEIQRKTLVVAGAGELTEGILETGRIINCGNTSPESMLEKATYVMQVMEERLLGLGGSWDLVDAIDIYTIYPLVDLLQQAILPKLGPANRHGVHWYYSRPPIMDIDFEMDLHGVVTNLVV
ncbi:MAG: 2-amino-5-chloromuconate deaminase CnbZ [Candidatus Latescibacterota bacterium]|jgi:hypothetical protein|tara:strand:- start:212 stop:961 length:750 start_codon:yes stop_codon:yes gene_type:complete